MDITAQLERILDQILEGLELTSEKERIVSLISHLSENERTEILQKMADSIISLNLLFDCVGRILITPQMMREIRELFSTSENLKQYEPVLEQLFSVIEMMENRQNLEEPQRTKENKKRRTGIKKSGDKKRRV